MGVGGELITGVLGGMGGGWGCSLGEVGGVGRGQFVGMLKREKGGCRGYVIHVAFTEGDMFCCYILYRRYSHFYSLLSRLLLLSVFLTLHPNNFTIYYKVLFVNPYCKVLLRVAKFNHRALFGIKWQKYTYCFVLDLVKIHPGMPYRGIFEIKNSPFR